MSISTVLRTVLMENSGRPARVVWLSGLSGAGKTTLADALSLRLREQGVAQLDGDELRRGLCADLGFCDHSRAENLRRAAHVARLMSDAGLTVVCAFISPLERDRRQVREILGERLLEVFVDTSLAECERRDPKGLYRRARAGEIPAFTGVSAPFEAPTSSDLVLRTEETGIGGLVEAMLDRLRETRLAEGHFVGAAI